jgi:hypothetical protein
MLVLLHRNVSFDGHSVALPESTSKSVSVEIKLREPTSIAPASAEDRGKSRAYVTSPVLTVGLQ